MSELSAGPWGPALAIAAMALATFLCRIAGAVLMSRISITPRVNRGLRALPGSIVLATIAPVALDQGAAAIVSLAATVIAMALTRREAIALAAGLGTLSLLRAFGP
ncbi:MAG: AzlD domain-containing protein [Microvirga sp.]